MGASIARYRPPSDETERRGIELRLWLAIPLTAALWALSLGPRWLGHPLAPAWLPLVVVSPIVLWCAWPLYRQAAISLLRGEPNNFTLAGPGAAAAFALGAFDAGATMVTMVLLARAVELRVRAGMRDTVPALRAMVPVTARRVRDDGGDEDVEIAALRAGDRIRVQPGDTIPVDGTVLEGISAASEAMLRGDPVPATKRPGAYVLASTINGSGPLVIRTEALGPRTLAARSAAQLTAAFGSTPPLQRRLGRAARALVALVPVIAVVALLSWWATEPEPEWTHGTCAALAVVFAASPWALTLAPLSMLITVAKVAAMGVVFGDAGAIEALQRVDVVVIDKTGTLTEGTPRVVSVRPTVGFDKQQVLRLAASVESASQHPLAVAIVTAARDEGLVLRDAQQLQSFTGKGVSGRVGGRHVLFGNRGLMAEAGIALDDLPQRAEPLRAQGQTVMFLAVDGVPAGLVSVADPIKARTQEAVAMLHHEGVRIVLITGDHASTAQTLGAVVGVDEVHADMLPDEKRDHVEYLRALGHVVAVVGHGANDLPALERADVAIAMISGGQGAVTTAAITIIEGDLRGVARARILGRYALRIAHENVALAIAYNVAGIAFASGALFPFTGVAPNPGIAAVGMASAVLTVIGNGLRLRRLQI